MSLCPHLQAGANCPACIGQRQGTTYGDPQCPHGNFLGSFCAECVQAARQAPCPKNHGTHVVGSGQVECMHCGQNVLGQPLPSAPVRTPRDDARAQLWARVYVAEFVTWTRSDAQLEAKARAASVHAASIAVADFDEHYLGAKR